MLKSVCLLTLLLYAAAGSVAAQPQSVDAVRVAAATTFQDSVGEDPASADITTVAVSHDRTGLITFRINIANRPTLVSDLSVAVFIDTNQNTTDGAGPEAEGAEVLILLIAGQVELGRWNGSQFDFSAPSPSSLSYAYSDGATIRILASDLGATRLNFFAATVSGVDPDYHVDYAPDSGHWAYDARVASNPALRLVTQGFGYRVFPGPPKAPNELNAFLLVRRLDTGAQVRSGSVVCRASAGGRALPLLGAGGFFRGTVNCNWRLPKWARGKIVRGTVTVTVQGTTVVRAFSVRIR